LTAFLVPLHVLPSRSANAAENMATDFLLLQRYPDPAAARFRSYGWHRPAFTFGYSQKINEVRSHLPPGGAWEVCRRATGGGLVDHRNDWTYCLVLPRGHPLEEARATEAYRTVHAAIADALNAQGQPARLQESLPPANPAGAEPAGAGVCFVRAELFDVVHPVSGAKIAGAALKRNKKGLLVQGSIARAATAAALDWDAFAGTFVQHLATGLSLDAMESPWPDLAEEELSALIDQYGSSEWNEFR
jgi:lipoate-protein ligase A